MADNQERHGIEVGIDSTGAKSGEDRVVRSLDNIKKKTEEVGRAGEAAGKTHGAGLGRAATQADRTGRSLDGIKAKARGAGDAGASAGTRAANAWHQAQRRIDATTFAAARMHPPLQAIESTMGRTRRIQPFEAMDRQMPNVIGRLTTMRSLLLGIGGIVAAQEIARTTVQFKAFDQAMKIVTGSSAAASEELAWAERTADKLGFRVRDVTQFYVQFAAAAQGTRIEGEGTRHVFESITRAAAAYGLTNEQLRGSLLAVQQMIGKGTVSAEELRGQLGERLPGAVQIAARAMDVTTQELFKMMEQGKLTSDVFLQRFANQLDKEIPQGARSANAAFNEFLSQLDRAKLAVAEGGFFEGLTAGAKALADTMERLGDSGALRAFGDALGTVLQLIGENIHLLGLAAVAFAAYFVAIKVTALAAFISQLMALEMALGASTAAAAAGGVALKGLQGILAVMLGPIGLLVAGVTAVAGAWMYLSDTSSRTDKVLQDTNQTLRDAADELAKAKHWGDEAANTITETGTDADTATPKIRAFAGEVGNAAQELFNLARARQADYIAQLEQKRQQASLQFSELWEQTEAGRRARANVPIRTDSLSEFFGSLGTRAGANLEDMWFGGTREEELQAGMDRARRSMGMFDEAIQEARKSLERFVPEKPAPLGPGRTGGGGASQNFETRQTWTLDQVSQLIRASGGNITSGWRSREQQQELYDAWVAGGRKGLVAKPGTSAHEFGQALDITGMSKAEVRKALKGVPIKELFDEGDHIHVAWGKAGDAMADATREMERQAQLAENRKRNEAEFWAQLQGQVDEAGKLPLEAEKFNRELELRRILNDGELAGAKELSAEQKKRLDDLIRERDTKRFITDSAMIRQDLERQTTRLLDQQLALQGRSEEEIEDALALEERMWGHKQRALDLGLNLQDATVKKTLEELLLREKTNIEIERKNRLIDEGNRLVDELLDRQDPRRAITRDFVLDRRRIESSTRTQAEKDRALKELTDQFRDDMNDVADEWHRAMLDHVRDIGDAFGGAFGDFVAAFGSLILILNQMADKYYRAGTVGAQADNPISRIASGLQGMANILTKSFGNTKTGTFFKGVSEILGKVSDGAAVGEQVAGLAKAIGIKFSSTGASIGGAIGSFLPIPGGQIIGSIAGGLIGSLFGGKKAPKGGAVITDVFEEAVYQGSGKLEDTYLGAASSIQEGLRRIADALGASVGAFNVAIGEYDGDIRVNTLGRVTGRSLRAGQPGTHDFDDDMQAAIAFAILDAIRDGALQGLTDATERILRGATEQNLDRLLQAAQIYEQLVREAGRSADPVQAAWEEFIENMQKTMQLLKSAGYTYEELAALQPVFARQQEEVLAQLTEGYRALLEAMTTGPNSGMTIWAQFQEAMTAFRTLAASGTATQEQFTEAGQRAFELARQVYGTATPEFEAIRAELVAATQAAIDQVETAQQAALDSAGIIGAINAGTGEQVTTNSLLTAILNQLYGRSPTAPTEPTTTPTSPYSVGGVNDNFSGGVRSGGHLSRY